MLAFIKSPSQNHLVDNPIVFQLISDVQESVNFDIIID
jgi:hypothetical protein